MSELCSAASLAAQEPLAATATTAEHWLLLEVPGAWPRDVGDAGALPEAAHEAVARWLAAVPRSRLQFIRRPGRSRGDLVVFVVTAAERSGLVRRFALREHAELADLDLDTAGTAGERSLVLVCGHGSRDRCCARFGTRVYSALEARLAEDEVWISSHQGGHRFAANLLVLPSGLQFGRVEPEQAPLVAARALAGRIDLDRYRGRTCYPSAVQAAEVAIRRANDLEGVADLALVAVDDAAVTFRAWHGAEYTATVEETAGPSVPSSCGEPPSVQRHFRAAPATRP